MRTHASSNIWLYLMILPSLVILLGLALVFSAYTLNWGVESEIPIAMLLALFFAEISMVIAGLGVVGFIKTKPKTIKIKYLGLWNASLMITACITGYNIFMIL